MVQNRNYRIAVMPGDGTGPEVVREALKALSAVSEKDGFKLELGHYDLGGDRYLKTGEVLPQTAVDELRTFQAILLGAIGHPEVKPGILEKGLLLELRFQLDQYVNLRPVILFPGVETPLKDKGPEEINFVVVRENTEGLYAGTGGFLRKGTPHEVAVQESVNTRMGVERCIRYAFEYCRKRNQRKKLTLCGKTNVLTFAFDLWERTFYEVAKDYPDVQTDYAHVDATCMWMVKNPEWFDVIVTDNMFGDIITDLGAMIQGGMGIAAGGNINPQGVSMFEPIGGSAPKYTGKNIINPLAAIGAAQMMLEHLGEDKSAARIDQAIRKVVAHDLKSLSAGQMGYTTSEVGDLVARYIQDSSDGLKGGGSASESPENSDGSVRPSPPLWPKSSRPHPSAGSLDHRGLA
jgi:3-isopropylmalate dehydrogenase